MSSAQTAPPPKGRSGAAPKDLRIAIIGGGIGGLCCGIGLIRHGLHNVHIYESAPRFSEIGAGISLGRNAQNALRELGLLKEDVAQICDSVESGLYFQLRDARDNSLQEEIYHRPLGQCSVHRAKFLDRILAHFPAEQVHFGKRLKELRQVSTPEAGIMPVTMTFHDGEEAHADLVIGYDGIRSTVRNHLDPIRSGLPTSPSTSCIQWSGTWAYRSMIPRSKMLATLGEKEGAFYVDTPQMWFAPDTHIITFPIDAGQIYNVVAFVTDRSRRPERTPFPPDRAWTEEADAQEMIKAFRERGWHEVPSKVLGLFEKPSRWALHQIVPSLKSYVNGRIVVAGDAAHGGVPHLGAMAGQAIEDALFLSRLLSQPQVNKENLTSTLEIYDTLRVPRANAVLEASLAQGDIYECYGPYGADMGKLCAQARNSWEYVVGHDFDEEMRQIERKCATLTLKVARGSVRG